MLLMNFTTETYFPNGFPHAFGHLKCCSPSQVPSANRLHTPTYSSREWYKLDAAKRCGDAQRSIRKGLIQVDEGIWKARAQVLALC